jgi:uncharacterized protein (DUF2336 family)
LKIMVAEKFLEWAKTASPAKRAEAAGALARAFLCCELKEAEHEEARLILTVLLDDPSPLVRRALAEAFASATNVPHYMVLTLAGDHSEIAAIVLARSPLLSDAELIDCAAATDGVGQSAIALRPLVPAPVAAALAEVADRQALASLAANPGAELLESSIRRMIERHGDDANLRKALLSRPKLSAALRSDLAGAEAKALMTGCARLPLAKAGSLMQAARERANVQIAAETVSEAGGTLRFVAYLRRSSQLTAGFLLRGLLCGNKHLLAAALCELSGIPMARITRAMARSRSARFAALYRKAKMPERLLPVFVEGLEAIAKLRCCGPVNAYLQRPLITSVLEACAALNHGELDHVIARLRQLEAEAAREEACNFRRTLAPEPRAMQDRDGPRRLTRGAANSILTAGLAPASLQMPLRSRAEGIPIDLKALPAEFAAA